MARYRTRIEAAPGFPSSPDVPGARGLILWPGALRHGGRDRGTGLPPSRPWQPMGSTWPIPRRPPPGGDRPDRAHLGADARGTEGACNAGLRRRGPGPPQHQLWTSGGGPIRASKYLRTGSKIPYGRPHRRSQPGGGPCGTTHNIAGGVQHQPSGSRMYPLSRPCPPGTATRGSPQPPDVAPTRPGPRGPRWRRNPQPRTVRPAAGQGPPQASWFRMRGASSWIASSQWNRSAPPPAFGL